MSGLTDRYERKDDIMNVHQLKEIINNLPDNMEVEVNSIFQDGKWELSEISEAHYDESRNKMIITPEIVSI
jgi:hypothetical protein